MFDLPVSNILGLSVIIIFTGVIMFLMQHLLGQVILFNPKKQSAIPRDVFGCLKKSLQMWYTKKLALTNEQESLCMEEYYVDLTISEMRKAGKGTSKTESDVHVEDLVINASEQSTNILHLLIGSSGFGKSVTCWKLAYDWAIEKYYMSQFSLVVFVPFSEYEGEGINEFVLRVLSRSGLDRDAITNEILTTTHNILLIFDGLNEIDFEERAAFYNFMEKLKSERIFSNSNIIVASQLIDEDMQSYFHRVFVLRGIQNADQLSAFVHNYEKRKFNIPSLTWDEQITRYDFRSGEKKIVRTTRHNEKIAENYWKNLVSKTMLVSEEKSCKSPLILHILYALLFNSQTLLRMRSESDFLEYLFEILLKRCYCQNVKEASKFMKSNTDWEFLSPLGEFFLQLAIAKKPYSFQLKEIRNKVGEAARLLLSLGIFENIDMGSENGEMYTPVHGIVAEYVIAVYFENCIKNEQLKDENQKYAPIISEEIITKIDQTESSENILRFLTSRLRL